MVALLALVGCGPNVMMPVDRAGCEWSTDMDVDVDGVWDARLEGSEHDGLRMEDWTVEQFTRHSESRVDPETGCESLALEETLYADGRSEGTRETYTCDEYGNRIAGTWEQWTVDGQVAVYELEAEATVEDGLTIALREVFTERANGTEYVYTTTKAFDAEGNVVQSERHREEGDERVLLWSRRAEWSFVNKHLGFVRTWSEDDVPGEPLVVNTSSLDEHGRVVLHRTETGDTVSESEHEWMPEHWWMASSTERVDGEEVWRVEMNYPVLEDDHVERVYGMDGWSGAPVDGVVDYREDFVMTCE